MAMSFFAKTMIMTEELFQQMHQRLAFRLYRDHLSCFKLSGPIYVGIPKRLG